MGSGPFLWLSPKATEYNFNKIPPGGMCLSVFLFVCFENKILLGKYADHPEWDRLAGLDESRRREGGCGWTIPGRQLRFGEHPRDAARQIGEDILGFSGLHYEQPWVETETWESTSMPGNMHFDVWFFVDAELSKSQEHNTRPWYSTLEWHDPLRLPRKAYGRFHEDVVARWLQKRTNGERATYDLSTMLPE